MVWQPQHSLGGLTPYPPQVYNILKMCRVTSLADFQATGKVEIVTLDGSAPVPAWCLGELVGFGGDSPYQEGDIVVAGFIDGNKDNPVVLGKIIRKP